MRPVQDTQETKVVRLPKEKGLRLFHRHDCCDKHLSIRAIHQQHQPFRCPERNLDPTCMRTESTMSIKEKEPEKMEERYRPWDASFSQVGRSPAPEPILLKGAAITIHRHHRAVVFAIPTQSALGGPHRVHVQQTSEVLSEKITAACTNDAPTTLQTIHSCSGVFFRSRIRSCG